MYRISVAEFSNMDQESHLLSREAIGFKIKSSTSLSRQRSERSVPFVRDQFRLMVCLFLHIYVFFSQNGLFARYSQIPIVQRTKSFFLYFFTSTYRSLITIRVPFVGDKICKYFLPNNYISLVGVVFFMHFYQILGQEHCGGDHVTVGIQSLFDKCQLIAFRLENHYDQYKDYTFGELLDEMILQMDTAFDYTTNQEYGVKWLQAKRVFASYDQSRITYGVIHGLYLHDSSSGMSGFYRNSDQSYYISVNNLYVYDITHLSREEAYLLKSMRSIFVVPIVARLWMGEDTVTGFTMRPSEDVYQKSHDIQQQLPHLYGFTGNYIHGVSAIDLSVLFNNLKVNNLNSLADNSPGMVVYSAFLHKNNKNNDKK